MYTFTGLGTGRGEWQDVETGAVATWKILYNGDREEKGTRTMTPTMQTEHSRCGAAEQRPRDRHSGPAGGPGRPARGRRPSVPPSLRYSHSGGEKHKVQVSKSCSMAFPQGSHFQKQTSLDSRLFSRWAAGPGRRASELSCHTGRASPPGSRPLLTQTGQEGRTQKSLGSGKGLAHREWPPG